MSRVLPKRPDPPLLGDMPPASLEKKPVDTKYGALHPSLAASLEAALRFSREGVKEDSEEDAGISEEAQGHPLVQAENSTEENEAEVKPSDTTDSDVTTSEALPATTDDTDEEEDDEEEEDNDEDDEEDDDEESAYSKMTLRDHLVELRKRVTRAFLCALLGFFVCYPFAEDIYNALLVPLVKVMPENSMLIYTSLPEAFFTYLKVSFFTGIFVASPLIFYQVWAFIAPGLYKEEKTYIIPVAVMSAVCFIGGGSFCFFVVFPIAFEFFMSYNVGRIQAMPSLREYLSFILQLIFAFGLVFEMPLFIFFLAKLGIVTAAWLRKFRRYAILITFIVAAILTPPDVLSQLLMAGPMLLLYEISIGIAALFGKKTPPPAEEHEEHTESHVA